MSRGRSGYVWAVFLSSTLHPLADNTCRIECCQTSQASGRCTEIVEGILVETLNEPSVQIYHQFSIFPLVSVCGC